MSINIVNLLWPTMSLEVIRILKIVITSSNYSFLLFSEVYSCIIDINRMWKILSCVNFIDRYLIFIDILCLIYVHTLDILYKLNLWLFLLKINDILQDVMNPQPSIHTDFPFPDELRLPKQTWNDDLFRDMEIHSITFKKKWNKYKIIMFKSICFIKHCKPLR